MFKKNNQGTRPYLNTLSGPSRYDALEILEYLQAIDQKVATLSEIRLQLQNAMAKQQITIEQKQYLTIEDVTRIYDISARTQSQERSAGRLRCLKKIDGQKILYAPEHLKEYISKYYQEK